MIQGSKPHLLHLRHWQMDPLSLAPPGKPQILGWDAGMDEAQAGIKIAGRNISNLRYAYLHTTLMAESEEELKSLVMKVKQESEKVGLNSRFKKLRSWHLVPSLHGK